MNTDTLYRHVVRPKSRPGRRTKTFPTGRVCSYKECSVVLSIYNRSDRCSQHSWTWKWRAW
jgi:hypothetical protein